MKFYPDLLVHIGPVIRIWKNGIHHGRETRVGFSRLPKTFGSIGFKITI
ncbi:hypothetical protein Hanom_Chr03g00187941 [Helianthus anomalus]